MPDVLDRIYLDSCVLNRPADDQTQPRIRAETAAIEQIFDLAAAGKIYWITSPVIEFEISRNPDGDHRDDALRLMRHASEFARPTKATLERALALQASGFGRFDAIHLCLAVQAGAGWLLTVDDRFLRSSARLHGAGLPTVENPLDWVRRRKPWLLPT